MVLHVFSPTKPYQDPCSRCESLWWFWLGRDALTNRYHVTDLAVDQYKIVLPIITSRGVKYTHNDIKHLVLHPDSGPPGIRPIPPEHPPKKVVMRDPYVIAINRTPQRIDAVFRFMIRWLIIANIVLGLFTIFNIYIYPKYIYERPEPVLISEPVDQLLPYEI